MTKVKVKYIDTGQSSMDEDGEFKCDHINLDIEEPCCKVGSSGTDIECGCQGRRSYYCNDCKNKELTDEQINIIEEGSL